MAQNKRNIKNSPTYKISNPQYEKLKEQNERRDAREAKLAKFKVPKRTKAKMQKLLALAGAGLILVNLSAEVVHAHQYDKDNNSTKKTGISQQDFENDSSSSDISIGTVRNGTQIADDGHNYLIDANSIVISSKGDSLAIDEDGIIRKGDIDTSKFTEIFTMTEDEMADYSIYQVDVIDGVNVRGAPSTEEDNVISTLAFKDYVLGRKTDTIENENKWISTISVSMDNVVYEGYIREDLVSEVGEFDLIYDNVDATLMKVDTSKDGKMDLNLRTNPEIFYNRNVMRTIPHGSIIKFLGEETKIDDRSWSKVEYKGTQGWVSSDYLQEYFSQEKTEQTSETIQIQQNTDNRTQHTQNVESINTNATGNVTGIDISSLSPNELQELLQSGIPRGVSSAFGDVDTNKLAGDINFVYIKLGASSYGDGELETLNYAKYEEQVKVCEELGIPYGFYYYSTSTTVEEANVELKHIYQKIANLRSNVNMEYNDLDMVVDIELAGTNDRQYQGNIKQQTEAKAALINGIQESGISDNVLIYGPMRVMKPDLDQIFSLSDLQSMLSNPDNVNLWLCARANQKGQLPSSFESDVSYAKEHGFDTVMTQMVLDANVIGRIDINNMNIEHYQKLVEHNREIVQLDKDDDGR